MKLAVTFNDNPKGYIIYNVLRVTLDKQTKEYTIHVLNDDKIEKVYDLPINNVGIPYVSNENKEAIIIMHDVSGFDIIN